MKKLKIYMGIPSVGNRSDAQCYSLRDMAELYKDQIEFVYPKIFAQRIFHDFARNAIVDEFLATDCDLLWFLDSDIAPPRNLPDLLLKHDYDSWKIAGAPYPIFMTVQGTEGPQVLFTAYNSGDDGKLRPGRIPYQGTDFVDALATGCLFIKREVFALLKAPYFEFKFNPNTRCMEEGEDLGLALKLKDMGIKYFTDYSLVCKHYKMVDLLEVNNYAIDYSNNNLKGYDKELRDQTKEALRQAYERGLAAGRQKSGEPSLTRSGLIIPGGFRG